MCLGCAPTFAAKIKCYITSTPFPFITNDVLVYGHRHQMHEMFPLLFFGKIFTCQNLRSMHVWNSLTPLNIDIGCRRCSPPPLANNCLPITFLFLYHHACTWNSLTPFNIDISCTRCSPPPLANNCLPISFPSSLGVDHTQWPLHFVKSQPRTS